MFNILQTLTRALGFAREKTRRDTGTREPRKIVISSNNYKPGRNEEKALNDLIQQVGTIEEFTFVDRHRLLKYADLGNSIDTKENETFSGNDNSIGERQLLGKGVTDSISVTNKQIITSLLSELKEYRDLYKDNTPQMTRSLIMNIDHIAVTILLQYQYLSLIKIIGDRSLLFPLKPKWRGVCCRVISEGKSENW